LSSLTQRVVVSHNSGMGNFSTNAPGQEGLGEQPAGPFSCPALVASKFVRRTSAMARPAAVTITLGVLALHGAGSTSHVTSESAAGTGVCGVTRPPVVGIRAVNHVGVVIARALQARRIVRAGLIRPLLYGVQVARLRISSDRNSGVGRVAHT